LLLFIQRCCRYWDHKVHNVDERSLLRNVHGKSWVWSLGKVTQKDIKFGLKIKSFVNLNFARRTTCMHDRYYCDEKIILRFILLSYGMEIRLSGNDSNSVQWQFYFGTHFFINITRLLDVIPCILVDISYNLEGTCHPCVQMKPEDNISPLANLRHYNLSVNIFFRTFSQIRFGF